MNNEFIAKLNRLKGIRDQVFYRWRCCSKKMASMRYIAMSVVRLESLACYNGKVTLSLAAGYIHESRKGSLPRIIFRDNNVVRSTGAKGGHNLPMEWVRVGADFEIVNNCVSYDVTERSNSWVASRVMSMSLSPYYDVNGIIQPHWYRRTKTPESFTVATNKDAFKRIGWRAGDTIEDIQKRFMDNPDILGQFTDDGYIVPFELISRGGMVCCAKNELLNSKYVYCVNGGLFRAEAKKLGWDLKTGQGVDDGVQDLGGLAGALEL